MSTLTLLEFDHDQAPYGPEECLRLGRKLQAYMHGGAADNLPPGVRCIDQRHHSDPTLWGAAQEPFAVLAGIVSAYADALPAEIVKRAQAALDRARPVLKRGVIVRAGQPGEAK